MMVVIGEFAKFREAAREGSILARDFKLSIDLVRRERGWTLEADVIISEMLGEENPNSLEEGLDEDLDEEQFRWRLYHPNSPPKPDGEHAIIFETNEFRRAISKAMSVAQLCQCRDVYILSNPYGAQRMFTVCAPARFRRDMYEYPYLGPPPSDLLECEEGGLGSDPGWNEEDDAMNDEPD